MIDYSKTKRGDILEIVGEGAPGQAEIGDLVRVTGVGEKGVTVETKTGSTIEFVFNCGAARLKPTQWRNDFPQPAEVGAAAEMPKYKCKKIVHALKIRSVVSHSAGGARITPTEERYASFEVKPEYVEKHNPKAGGYFVVYEDGYQSWSPAKAFEEGYDRI